MIEAAAPEAQLEVPPPTSPGTLRALGPHLWEATFEREGPSTGRFAATQQVSRLVWNDLDVYRYEEIANGQMLREERRIDRDVFRRQSVTAPWLKTRDVAGNSMILQRTLRLWNQALNAFGTQAVYERLEDSLIEGRPVRVYRLRLGPLAAPTAALPLTPEQAADRQSLVAEPLSLEGLVYVDEETGNRLLAEVEGIFVPRRPRDAEEIRLIYRETRSITPLPPDIVPPEGTIRDLSRPGAPRRPQTAGKTPG